MTRYATASTLAALAVSLVACGNADGQSGTTRAEERQLDEAAAALDEAQAEYESAIQAAEPDPQNAEPQNP
ncbi:MAG: hypothetical protein AAGE05_07355 [Pseudomonadota bacterium]